MAKLEFRDLEFDGSRVIFLKRFYFEMDEDELAEIGSHTGNAIKIEGSEAAARQKLNAVLDRGLSRLRSISTNRRAYYIHSNAGIPLIGSNYFGIIDRNTNLIEVRPITGCNLNCNYCSVDEAGQKAADYVVQAEYLVSEFRKLAMLREPDIEAHINAQGEPLMYSQMAELVKGLADIPGVMRISLDTNGILLSDAMIKELSLAGLTQLNISLNAISMDKAKLIAGCPYPVKHVLSMAKKAKKAGIEVLLAPVLLPGLNEDEMPGIIAFAKEIGARVGIQNFMSYTRGRKPVKEAPMDEFMDYLRALEKEYDTKLILGPEDFLITKRTALTKPFRKGQVISADYAFPGREKGESIVYSRGRLIHAHGEHGRRIKVKLTREKHNIFYGSCI